jgi:hypothetical protein
MMRRVVSTSILGSLFIAAVACTLPPAEPSSGSNFAQSSDTGTVQPDGTPEPNGKTIWKGMADGAVLEWNTDEIRVIRDNKAVDILKPSLLELHRSAVKRVLSFDPTKFETTSVTDRAHAVVRSVVGPYVTIDEDYFISDSSLVSFVFDRLDGNYVVVLIPLVRYAAARESRVRSIELRLRIPERLVQPLREADSMKAGYLHRSMNEISGDRMREITIRSGLTLTK